MRRPGAGPVTTRFAEASPARVVDEHTYLSTACLHGRHGYCASMTGYQGEKRPARCKFCDSRCICACHQVEESGSGV